MTVFKLPHIHRFRDRHGTVRIYFRRKGVSRVALPGRLGSAEFMAAYASAMNGVAPSPASRYGKGTIGSLWTDYCRSAAYANLSSSSKHTYRLVMASILEAHGHRFVSGMQRQHARGIIEDIGITKPAQANLTRSVMRLLMSFAVENGWRSDNPFQKLIKYKLGEHHSWTDEQLIAYENYWPLGSRERLTFDLLLFTAQRGGDAVKIRHVDISNGQIPVIQQKTGTKLLIPVHPDLERSIKSIPKKGIFVLADALGRPIQRQSVTRIIRIAARKAGLPKECVAHGLRKAALRRLAERGASHKEIAAVSGHKSMNEVQRYTAAADQAGLAREAMKRIPHKE